MGNMWNAYHVLAEAGIVQQQELQTLRLWLDLFN
jgi:hypothetical protein